MIEREPLPAGPVDRLDYALAKAICESAILTGTITPAIETWYRTLYNAFREAPAGRIAENMARWDARQATKRAARAKRWQELRRRFEEGGDAA
jgi:hypothetical protein